VTEEQAEHGDGAHPISQAGEPEAADLQTDYAEPDRLGSTARAEEPPDDPGDR
jgi:hypothetical protein